MFEYRFDRALLQNPVSEDGFLRAKVRITKPGVYPYLLPDGTVRREAKLPEEIYSEKFLKSLDGLIVTDGHPYEFGGIVNSENYRSLMKGIITNPRIENGFVVADEVIFDRSLIEAVQSGEKLEVSLGAKAGQTNEPGFLAGDRFDSAQTDLSPNHIAHVLKGRIGPEARILLDGIQYAIQGEADMDVKPGEAPAVTEEPGWVKKIMDGFEKLFSLFTKDETEETAPAPVADAKAETAKPADVSGYEKKIADLQKAIDTMTASLGMKMDEAVRRESLLDAVKAVLPDADLRGLSNLEIKKTLVKNVLPDVKLDSDDLVDVYYNASLELAKAKAKLNPGSSSEPRLDGADLEALKNKRLNLYIDGRK